MHNNGGNSVPFSSSPLNCNQEQPSNLPNQNRILENLKAAVFARLAKTHPNKPLSPAQIAALESRIVEAFPAIHMPTNNTYASMIENAIKGLNEDGGSSEKAISDYIVKNFEGLPWAHERYLSHYLDKLCKNDEIVCVSGDRYTLKELMPQPSLKNKQLRRKPGRKKKECVTEEGNLDGGKLIGGVKENDVSFQDDEVQVFGKGRRKGRRSSSVVYEEDEEVGGTGVVGREENRTKRNEMPVIEGRNDGLELVGGDENDRKLEKQDAGAVDGDHDGVIVGQGTCEVKLVESSVEQAPPIECQDEVRTDVSAFGDDPSEGKTEAQLPFVPSAEEEILPTGHRDEMRTEVLALDRDPREEKTEPQLSLVPSTEEKTLPAECENEVTTETLKLDCDSTGASLMLVPVESVNKSMLAPIEGDTAQGSVLNIDGDAATDTSKKMDLMGKDHTSYAADLMIVPFEGEFPKPAVKEIICGLPCQEPGQAKRKQQVYRPRRRLKQCQQGPSPVLEKVMPASLVSPVGVKMVEQGQLCRVSPKKGGFETKLNLASLESSKCNESSSQSQQDCISSLHGPTPMISGDKGSIEHEFQKKNLHSESSRSSGPLELMSTEDEDLNVTLLQVKEKVFAQRKHSSQTLTAKASLTSLESSVSGANVQAELPDSENLSKWASQRGEEVTYNKRNQMQGPQQQHPQKRRLPPRGQRHYNLEAETVTATESEVLLSSQLEKRSNNGQEHEDQEPQTVHSVAVTAQFAREHQHQGSSPHVELTTETPSLDNQHRELGVYGENKQTSGQHGLRPKPGQTMEIILRESSPTQNKDGQKEDPKQQHQSEMDEGGCGDSEPVKIAIMEKKVLLDNEQIQAMEKQGMEPNRQGLKGTPKATCPHDGLSPVPSTPQVHDDIAGQQERSQCPTNHDNPQQSAAELGEENAPTLSQSSEQKTKQLKRPRRGRPPKQTEAKEESVTASLLVQNQQQEKPSETSTSSMIEEETSMICQFNFDMKKSQEQKNEGRCLESESSPLDIAGGLVFSDNPPTQQPIIESLLAKPAQCHRDQIEDQQAQNVCEIGFQDSQPHLAKSVERKVPISNQHSQQQKKGRGRPRKQEELSESASHQCSWQKNKQPKKDGRGRPKKDGRGRPKKEKVEIVEDVANPHDQQQEGPSEPGTHHVSKTVGRGRPRKLKEAAGEGVAFPLNVHDQQQQDISEPATSHSIMKDGQGLPKEHNKETEKVMEATPDQQQPGSSEPAINQLKKKVGRDRQRKQKGASVQDVAGISFNDQKQQGPSESGNDQLIKKDGQGIPMKQNEAPITVEAAPLNLEDQQPEGALESATDTLEKKARPRKEKEATSEDLATSLNLLDQQQERPSPQDQQQEVTSEPTPYQLRKKDRCGRRSKQEVAAGMAISPNFHNQQQGSPSEPPTHQLKKKDGRGRRSKQKEATTEDVEAVPNLQDLQQEAPAPHKLHEQQQQGSSEKATNQVKRKDGRGRTRTRKETTTEDVTTAKKLHDHKQEGLFEPASQKREKRGRPRKQKEATLEDVEAPLIMHDQQQDGPSEPAPDQPISKLSVVQQEEKQFQHHEEKQGQLSGQGTVPKQKSAKMKPIQVPLASKDQLRSRKRPSQTGT